MLHFAYKTMFAAVVSVPFSAYVVPVPAADVFHPVKVQPVLTKFPELKDILVKLMTEDFKVFVDSIDWVAPKPTTFRINLKNGQTFYLIYTTKSWIAQIEGKKYYLLNINELQNGTNAISRILRYGTKEEATETKTETTTTATEKTTETPPAGEETAAA